MSIRASVVVPTFKRPELLRGCLEALSRQDFPVADYEIIVVDDAGTEDTRALVESFAGGAAPQEGCPVVHYLAARETQGPAAARNKGWRAARGAIIAFTDDDCLPDADWLKEGAAALEGGLDGAGGQVVVPVSGRPTDYQKNTSRLMEAEFVTANCFYRRSALQAVGGFDEDFKMAWREDSELFFRMLESSFRLGYAPAARVIHPVRKAPWGISLKEQRKSVYNALLYKKFPGLYRTRVQPLPPLRYYTILLLGVGFWISLLLHNQSVALVLALLWLMFTLQFALQRLEDTQLTLSHVLEMLLTSILIPPLSVFWRLVGAIRYRVFFL